MKNIGLIRDKMRDQISWDIYHKISPFLDTIYFKISDHATFHVKEQVNILVWEKMARNMSQIRRGITRNNTGRISNF
jgi:hypothetical protein